MPLYTHPHIHRTTINLLLTMWSLTKVGCFRPHLWGSKPLIHDSTHQICVSGNTRELLVGIKPRMSWSTTHPKPPTTTLHPNVLTTIKSKSLYDWNLKMKSFPKLIRSERERHTHSLTWIKVQNNIFIGQIIEIPSIFFFFLVFAEFHWGSCLKPPHFVWGSRPWSLNKCLTKGGSPHLST